MTEITPANGQPHPLVSRQAGALPAPAVQPPAHLGAFKPENLQVAEQLAKANDMLPRHYIGKPGACLLLLDWCERNDVPLLEAAGEISFVHGKPNIGARLQKKLAARFGYRTQKIEGNETACTVAVFDPNGAEVGRFTYTMALAEAIGHGKSNDMYRKDPAQMLWHRATARALDQYGPGELSPVMADQAIEPDPVELARQPAAIEPGPAEEEPEVVVPKVAEAASMTTTPGDVLDEKGMRALLKVNGKKIVESMRAVQEQFPDQDLATLAAVVDNGQANPWLAEWAAR